MSRRSKVERNASLLVYAILAATILISVFKSSLVRFWLSIESPLTMRWHQRPLTGVGGPGDHEEKEKRGKAYEETEEDE